MITTEKLQKMIERFGASELDKLCSWFPGESKETVEKVIAEAKGLIYENGVVKIKTTNTNTSDDITYEMLLQLIDAYNTRTKDAFTHQNIGDLETLKVEAIKTFLAEKNTLELFQQSDIADIYIQVNKKNGNETFCVICRRFDEQVFNYLDELFTDEIVNIYYIESHYEMATIKEFLVKDCNEVIRRYMTTYKLEETTVNVFKITEETGE